jgi:hypothetical protein
MAKASNKCSSIAAANSSGKLQHLILPLIVVLSASELNVSSNLIRSSY